MMYCVAMSFKVSSPRTLLRSVPVCEKAGSRHGTLLLRT
jgi:hypothetical protein